MTIAVCVRCGALKHGAFKPCSRCGGAPNSDHETALALGLTDHYLDVNKLEQVGKTLESGQMVSLPDAFMKEMLTEVERSAHMMPRHPRTKEVIEPLTKQPAQHASGLCFKCWGVKPAFSEQCPQCGCVPTDEKSMVASLAVSGLFFSDVQLRELSHRIRLGPGDIDLWPVREKGLQALAQKFLERKAPPKERRAAAPGETERKVPWEPVPFSPMLPDLEHATLVSEGEGAAFRHAVFKNARPLMERAEPTGIVYLYVFMLYSKAIAAPAYFVTLEQSEPGTTFLCAFNSRGHHLNFGDGTSFAEDEAFTRKAMALASEEMEQLAGFRGPT